MAKFSTIKELSEQELSVRLKELKEEGLQLRLQHSAGQLENTARLRQIRREIAQVNTAITAKSEAK